MNPHDVHDRTITRSTEAGRRAYVLQQVRAYRLTAASKRDIMRSGARAGGRTRGQFLETAQLRAEAAAALAEVASRDLPLAELIAEEHAYLVHGIAVWGRKRHDDPGRIRYRRAIAAWLAPEVTCSGCAGRVYEVAADVWLAYDGHTARCPGVAEPGSHRPVTVPAGYPRAPWPSRPTRNTAVCARCRDRLAADDFGAWVSLTTDSYRCWPGPHAPLHSTT